MNVLVFAPHPDDEIIGCGGTIARHVAEGDRVWVCVVTRGKPPVFRHPPETYEKLPHDLYEEIEKSHEVLGIEETFYLQFPASMLESVPRYELNERIGEIIERTEPDVIYMPHFGDMQKDHYITADAVMVAVRPKGKHVVRSVYAYETLSETEWSIPHASNTFIPNVFIDVSHFMETKLRAMFCYDSQLGGFPNPRSIEAMISLAKYRGSTMRSMAAEAFMLIREYRRLGESGEKSVEKY